MSARIAIGPTHVGRPALVLLLCVSIIVSFAGGGALTWVARARAASPADQADCRRDRGVPVSAPDGSIVCIAKSAIVWEAGRR